MREAGCWRGRSLSRSPRVRVRRSHVESPRLGGCGAGEEPAVTCGLHRVGPGGAKSLSRGEVVTRLCGHVRPPPPPRTVPTLLEGRAGLCGGVHARGGGIQGHAFILKIIEKQKVKNKYCC